MNIPQDILQQVADEAFLPSSKIRLITSSIFDDWKNQAKDRRAVIQHALNNPAIAPFLSALPRRESPALAEATPPAEVAIIEEQAWVDPVCGCIRSPDAPKDSPCPICNPAAQVPLGPEDVPPGSVIRYKHTVSEEWDFVTSVFPTEVWTGDQSYSWDWLIRDWQINTSIPDTGRWDKDAWRPCSKPGKGVAK